MEYIIPRYCDIIINRFLYTPKMPCKQSLYKNLYDNYIGGSYFGVLDLYVLYPESKEEREKCITTGFAVNKDPLSIISCNSPKFSFQYKVFDHIRHTEEVLSGTFTTDNTEFNHILHPFLREFMMGTIYIIYSEEFTKYELALAEKLAEENQEDPVERVERAYPDSNFRLLRRVPVGDSE